MRVIIDADACPVLEIALDIAKYHKLPCTLVCDNSHYFSFDDVEIITVDRGADSADIRIANIVKAGDVVVTQDYGVAAMALGKKAKAINQNGLIFTESNIETLLFSRYINHKARLSGQRTRGPSKRTSHEDVAFMKSFRALLEEE